MGGERCSSWRVAQGHSFSVQSSAALDVKLVTSMVERLGSVLLVELLR